MTETPEEAMTETRCVAVCRDCEPPLPNPFYDRALAERWSERHRTTGHEVRLLDGWPDPDDAYGLAFPEVSP